MSFSFDRRVDETRFHMNWEAMMSLYNMNKGRKKKNVKQSFGDRAIKQIEDRHERKTDVKAES